MSTCRIGPFFHLSLLLGYHPHKNSGKSGDVRFRSHDRPRANVAHLLRYLTWGYLSKALVVVQPTTTKFVANGEVIFVGETRHTSRMTNDAELRCELACRDTVAIGVEQSGFRIISEPETELVALRVAVLLSCGAGSLGGMRRLLKGGDVPSSEV